MGSIPRQHSPHAIDSRYDGYATAAAVPNHLLSSRTEAVKVVLKNRQIRNNSRDSLSEMCNANIVVHLPAMFTLDCASGKLSIDL